METMPTGTSRLASKMYRWRDVPKSERPVCVRCGKPVDLHILASPGPNIHMNCEREKARYAGSRPSSPERGEPGKPLAGSPRSVPKGYGAPAKKYYGPTDPFAGWTRVNRVTESERSERERRKEVLRRELKASGISCRELAGLLVMDHTELKGRIWGGGVIYEEMFTRWTLVIEQEKARAPGRGRVDGRDIKQMRKAVGLSARALAERLGVSQGTLTGWERGKTRPTRADYELAVRIYRDEVERIHVAMRDGWRGR